MWVRLFLHANDLGEIFLQFISFLPFGADSVQVPTMVFLLCQQVCQARKFTQLGQKIHPSFQRIHFHFHPSIPSPTNRWKVETPPFPPIRKRIAHETLEDIFGQLQHHFTRQGVSGKERLPGNPGNPGLRIPWEWWIPNFMERNHKNPWDWHIYLYTFGWFVW